MLDAVVAGSVASALLSITMVGFSLWHGITDDTFLFPVTILSTTTIHTLSSVLIGDYTPLILPVIAGKALIDVGCTIVYLQQ